MADREKRAGHNSRGMLSHDEISTFCAQMAMCLKAGIPAEEGLRMLYEDMENPQGKAILQEVLEPVGQGEPLSAALGKSGRLPKYVVDMAEAGEGTGRLDDVMEALCAYYEREAAVARDIKGAVTYPLVMVLMMVVVILVLATRVLPIFNQVLVQLGSGLAGMPRGMMELGALIGRYSSVLAGAAALVAVAGLALRYTARGGALLSRWKGRVFATGKLAQGIALGRFASVMAMMLSSGMDTGQSLDMAYRLVDNQPVRDKIDACREYMGEGAPFAEALARAGIFTGTHARMVSVGFRTGSVDTVMHKLAERYGAEVDARINGIIAVLEPTLVAVLSVIVGMVLLSVMLPLMGVMSTIG